MKAYNRHGYKFELYRVMNEHEIIHVKVLEDHKEIDSGYMKSETAKRIFGYDIEKEETDYYKYPETGYMKEIIVD